MTGSDHPLRRYRKANGLTLEALAAKVSSTKATLSRIECGQMQPGLPLAKRLRTATGLSLDVLCQAEAAQ